MRLYKREDFIKLPAKTIYSRVNDHISELFLGLYCKISSGEYLHDWIEQDLISEGGFPNNITSGIDAIDYQLNLRDSFKDFETDLHCCGRDGMYEDSDLFVVWDKKDIKKLYDYLGDCI